MVVKWVKREWQTCEGRSRLTLKSSLLSFHHGSHTTGEEEKEKERRGKDHAKIFDANAEVQDRGSPLPWACLRFLSPPPPPPTMAWD